MGNIATTADLSDYSKRTELGAYALKDKDLAGYALKGDYLTKATADSVYALKGDLNGLNFLTKTTADASYATKGDYLTTATANTTYAPKGDYLTKTTADTTYATKGELGGYIKGDINNFMTKTTADLTYVSKSDLQKEVAKFGISCTGDYCVLPTGYKFAKNTLNSAQSCVFNGQNVALFCLDANSNVVKPAAGSVPVTAPVTAPATTPLATAASTGTAVKPNGATTAAMTGIAGA